jgi:hypothetical protein
LVCHHVSFAVNVLSGCDWMSTSVKICDVPSVGYLQRPLMDAGRVCVSDAEGGGEAGLLAAQPTTVQAMHANAKAFVKAAYSEAMAAGTMRSAVQLRRLETRKCTAPTATIIPGQTGARSCPIPRKTSCP